MIGLLNGHTCLCEGCIEVKEAVDLNIKWNTAVSEVLSEGKETVVHIDAGIKHDQFVSFVEIWRNLVRTVTEQCTRSILPADISPTLLNSHVVNSFDSNTDCILLLFYKAASEIWLSVFHVSN